MSKGSLKNIKKHQIETMNRHEISYHSNHFSLVPTSKTTHHLPPLQLCQTVSSGKTDHIFDHQSCLLRSHTLPFETTSFVCGQLQHTVQCHTEYNMMDPQSRVQFEGWWSTQHNTQNEVNEQTQVDKSHLQCPHTFSHIATAILTSNKKTMRCKYSRI